MVKGAEGVVLGGGLARSAEGGDGYESEEKRNSDAWVHG
jgi:hypothetical protein